MLFWTWNTSHSKNRVRPKMSALEHNDKDRLAPHASHPSQLPESISKTKVMSRRKSLRLLTATPDIPIPPSLRHSPYLTSSVFSQTLYSPSSPSDEDEKWLQDTIPIVPAPRRSLATEGGCSASGDRRGSIIHPSRRAAQKTSEMVMEESQNEDCDVYAGLALVPATTRTDSLAPPSLLLVPDEECRSSTVNRRRWSTSPRRTTYNLDPMQRN